MFKFNQCIHQQIAQGTLRTQGSNFCAFCSVAPASATVLHQKHPKHVSNTLQCCVHNASLETSHCASTCTVASMFLCSCDPNVKTLLLKKRNESWDGIATKSVHQGLSKDIIYRCNELDTISRCCHSPATNTKTYQVAEYACTLRLRIEPMRLAPVWLRQVPVVVKVCRSRCFIHTCHGQTN